jgi:hypothetical protein
MMMAVLPLPAPFAARLKWSVSYMNLHKERMGEKARLTFFDHAQVVGLALYDVLEPLDVGSQLLDLDVVELGGTFGVLGES